jgi:hypothetical protein
MAWYDFLTDIGGTGYNIFGAAPSENTKIMQEMGLFGADAVKKAQQKSLLQGLLTTGLAYAAQPKTGGYGSAIPYLAKAGLAGVQAAQSPYDQMGKDLEMRYKIENLNLERDSKNRTKEFVTEMVASGDPRWANLDKLGPNEQATAVTQYLQERFKSPTKTAPTRNKREIAIDEDGDGKPDRLDVITEQWNPVTSEFDEISRAPKEITTDTLFNEDTIELLANQYLQTGTVPTLGRGKTGEENRKALYDRVAKKAQEAGFSKDQLGNFMADIQSSKQELRSSSLSLNRFDTGPQGNTVRSLNVAVDHLDTFKELAEAINTGNIKDINRAKMFLAQRYNNPNLTEFNAAKQIISTEVAKAVVGSANLALADREELANVIDAANSWEELQAAIVGVQKLMAGQLDGLKSQYESSLDANTLKRNPFDERLNARTIEVLENVRGGGKKQKQISQKDQAAIKYYNSLPDNNVTKKEMGKILKQKGLIQ